VRFRLVALLLVFSLLALTIPTRYIQIIPTAAAFPNPTSTVFINEFHYDDSTAAGDTNEFVEIAGPAGTSLAGWSIVLYNGATPSAGTTYDTKALSGTIPSQQGGYGTVSISYPTNGIQNGSNDGIALVNGTTVVQFLCYEGTMTASNGPASGMACTDVGVAETNSTAPGSSLKLQGTGTKYGDFTWAVTTAHTRGAVNTGQTFDGGNNTNPGTLQFSSSTYNVNENGGSATITVTRVGGSSGAASVNYATVAGGSATANSDYTAASGTINFADGDAANKTFTVPVLDDTEFEGDETVSLSLTNPTGATLGAQSTATLTITDNEVANPVTPGSVVISQVYGGGGNSGAFYRYDFIEIFNRSSQPVNLNGWSVQYASAGGGAAATWNRRTPLSGVINPGQYFLIREASGNNENAADLPTPDVIGTIAMGGTDGKVALVSNNVDLPNGCPVGGTTIIDFVGYGTADCFEGTVAAPQLSNTTAALRTRNGCKDTDLNNLNFTEVAPAPRNSSTTPNVCPVGDFAPEVFSTNPANGSFNYPLAANVTVNFDANVNVTDGAFTLSCSNSGAHSLTVTGGPATYTLNPDTDFAPGETCTATVLASHVTSQGTTPVPMAADYVWTFGTLIIRDPAEHMVMGNPSGAVADEGTPLNFLMMKPQYALSYNNDKGIPNWTSWHLDSTWTTSVADRQNDFRSDNTLPAGFKHVTSGYNFATYGFDRGHMTPSADRTSSEEDNSATFLMTNMVPQASGNNQGPWNDLEGHIRTLLGGSANEIYILSGGHGVGGNSSTGHWDSILDTGGNTVTVPNVTWKVVMVMPRADGDDVARVNLSTRTFAVIMPNNDNIGDDDWKKYLATVDQVEALTGYNFYSNVPEAIQNVIEARLDDALDTAPVANGQSASTAEDTAKAITLTTTDFNVNNVFTYTVIGGPTHGVLSGTGADLTYTPFADYSGPDSFTFKVNDGAKDSNTATVNITVTPVNDAPELSGVPATATTNELSPYTFTATATDVDSGTLTFSLVGAPAGATIDPTSGQFNWTPTEAQGGTGAPFSFTVSVTDGEFSDQSVVSITVGEVNSAPTLAAIGPKFVLLGGTLTFTAVGADADLPAQGLSYSLTGSVPAGASIDQTSGIFNWTPTAAQAGQVYSFGVRVTDTFGDSADQPVSVGVGHNWSGLLQPVNPNGNSVFKLGSTVTVKFQLTGASAPITDAVVQLYVAKVTDEVVGTEEEADSNSNATEGNLFRYADGQYVFNLSTKGLTVGTYQLRIDMGDGVQRTVLISLR
jgi:DNA/RNA endonuclease G (NUC1)